MPTKPRLLAHLHPSTGEFADLIVSEIAFPKHHDCARLLEHWADCRAQNGQMVIGRDMPSRRLKRMMSSLYILEPNTDRTDFRFRLAPTGLVRRFGKDVTGRYLSQLYCLPAYEQYVTGLQRALELTCPIKWDVCLQRLDLEIMHFERVGIPVHSRDGAHLWILGGTFFF